MGGDVNRSKLCPNCVKYVSDQDPTCKHCGYRFDTGDVPATATIDPSQQMQTARKAGKWIALAVALLVLAGIALPVFMVARGVDSAADRFSDLEVPGISIPSIEFTPPTISDGGTGSFSNCRRTAMKWMRELLANDGAGSRSLSDLFIEASEDVGAASDDYWVIVQAFSGSQAAAIQKGTRAGLREARVQVAEGCREVYP